MQMIRQFISMRTNKRMLSNFRRIFGNLGKALLASGRYNKSY